MLIFYVWRVRRQTNRRWYRNICICTYRKSCQNENMRWQKVNVQLTQWHAPHTHTHKYTNAYNKTRWIKQINKHRLLTCNRFRVSISLNCSMFSCTTTHETCSQHIHIATWDRRSLLYGNHQHIRMHKAERSIQVHRYHVYLPWTESFRVSYLLEPIHDGSWCSTATHFP